MHTLWHFSDSSSKGENVLFFDWIQKYREEKTSLCLAINTIRSWIVSYEDKYLINQTFFEPYPEGLMEVDPIYSHLKEDLWE
jgi:uncharacterized protein YbgA (DUF1722 family)